MEKTLEELFKEHETEKDLMMISELVNVLEEPYKLHKEENLQKLYQYAAIVIQQNGKHPDGEVTRIEIEDNYGTVIRVNVIN